MAIAYNSSAKSIKTAATSHTLSYTCSSGSNRFLVVGIASLNGTTDICTGVTYNGVAMTAAVSGGVAIGGTFRIYLWYLVNPAAGANDIVVSFSSSKEAHIVAVDFTGVTQTSPIQTADSVSDSSGTVSGVDSNSLTVTDGSWVAGYFGTGGDRAATTVATTRQVNNDSTNSVTTAMGTSGPASAGTTTIRGDNNTANTPVAMLSISFKAATTFIPQVRTL